MTRVEVIERLKNAETHLRAMGVEHLSLFGSVARGDETPSSDIDLAAIFRSEQRIGLFQYAAIAFELESILGGAVDLVGEPARKPRMQIEIDRDRVHVF